MKKSCGNDNINSNNFNITNQRSLQYKQMSITKKNSLSISNFERKNKLWKHNNSLIISPLTEVSINRHSQESKVYEFSALEQYKNSKKLKLGKQKMDKIHYTLNIQQISSKAFEERIKTNSLYLNYKVNPFLIDKNQKMDKSIEKDQRQAKSIRKTTKQDKNMIEKLNQLKQKSTFNEMANRVKINQSNSKQMLSKIQKAKFKKLLKGKAQGKQNAQLGLQVKVQSTILKKNVFDQFDDIINRKQQSFFKTYNQQVPTNIFKINFDQNHTSFKSNKQILAEFYFCQNSIANKTHYKNTVDVFVQCSNISRLLAQGKSNQVNKDHKVAEADLTTKLQQIAFTDLIQVASGRLESQILQNYLNGDLKYGSNRDDLSSQCSNQDQVLYTPNTEQKGCCFQLNKYQKTQITKYLQEPLNIIQKKQKFLSNDIQQKLRKVLQFQLKATSSSIRDKNLRTNFKKQKEHLLTQQIQSSAKPYAKQLDKQIERKIRLNKIYKDRTESIKNEALISTFQFTRLHNNKLKSLSKDKKSISTWR